LKNLNSIFLSLGTNVGDKNKNLLEGLTFLKEFVNILSISSVYKTEPLLYEDQEDFLNIVTEIDYQGTAKSLLLIIKDIEIQMGRKKTFRYGPRIIDIDIIFFKGEEINEEDLIIPHYDWHNRLFVIQPLYELLNKPLNKSNYKIHQQKIIKIGKIEL
jgi:2-amino-4-hydroxy-6-hydroxymethyldihydropteridine diphosphokinase|tara:strand:+ start:170 stop:643 length:474 start_codon:yes stop_codon:yes gene_type:complete